MNAEAQKDYEKVLAQVLRLDKSAQENLIADLATRLGQGPGPHNNGPHPKMADILAKAHESLSGLNKDQYWVERERELVASRASWETLEEGSWRG